MLLNITRFENFMPRISTPALQANEETWFINMVHRY